MGVFLNGERLGNVPSPPLKPGDRIQLGTVQFTFDKIPDIVLESTKNKWIRHVLTITATGEKFIITPAHDTLIGRGDPQLNFTPDLDMGQYGPVGQRVSRHHALIQWRDGQPYLEDLGSGFDTRLRGELLLLGRATRLLQRPHMAGRLCLGLRCGGRAGNGCCLIDSMVPRLLTEMAPLLKNWRQGRHFCFRF